MFLIDWTFSLHLFPIHHPLMAIDFISSFCSGVSFAYIFGLLSLFIIVRCFTSIVLLFFLFVDYCPLDLLKMTFFFHLRALVYTAADSDRRLDQTSESIFVNAFNFRFFDHCVYFVFFLNQFANITLL